jgi:beta-lactamase class D
MQAFLDRASYGNRDISAGIDRFWLGSSLRISPREQVDALGELLTDGLGFSGASIAEMRDLAYEETVDGCRVYGKTGSGPVAEERWHGWYVGWRECGDDDLVTFAVFLEAATYAELRDRRYDTAIRALSELSLLPR